MYSFNNDTKVLSSFQLEPFYHPFVTAGQYAIHYLQKDPGKVVQVCYDDGVALTAGELAKLGLRLAKNLSREGFRVGDVIGFVAKNTTYVAPLVLASLLIGAPCSTLDPSFEVSEIALIFKQTKPKIVFCDHDNYMNVTEALGSINNESEVLTVDEKFDGIKS